MHVGQYLVEGSRVTTLEGIANYFHIDFAMPAHVADEIAIRDHVEVQIVESEPPRLAEIIAVDASADAISRSVMARAILQDPPTTMQPKDSARVTVYYGGPIEACVVPATSVRRDPSGTVVFVASDTETGVRAHSRQVAVAMNVGGNAMIVDGLIPGDRVVANGSFKVSENALLADATIASTTEPDSPPTDARETDELSHPSSKPESGK